MPPDHAGRREEPPSGRLLRRIRRALGFARFDYTLSVCAIFKNEACYLDDWLTFHAGVGVGHFFLYNNESDDRFMDVLRPWIVAGKATLVEWPGKGAQEQAYNHCLRHHGDRTQWLAFIDVDEYLFSPGGRPLPQVLRTYARQPAVFVYWWLYGSSGNIDRPAQPVVETCVRRFDFASWRGRRPRTTGRPAQGKSIVNPRKVQRMGIHMPRRLSGKICDEKKLATRPEDVSPERHTTGILRINHYWARSMQDLRDKTARGRASNGRMKDLDRMIEWESALNAVEDRAILPIWEAIRNARNPSPSS